MRRVTPLLTMLAFAVAPAAASAEIHSVGFNEYPYNTPITDQYAGEGVVFGDGPGTTDGMTPRIRTVPGSNTVPPGTLGGFTSCGTSGEFARCHLDLWVKFTIPQRSIVTRIGHRRNTAQDFKVDAEFFDVDGKSLGADHGTVPAGAGLAEQTFRVPSYFPCPSDPCEEEPAPAYWVHLTADGEADPNREIVIDDLRFRATDTRVVPEWSITRDPKETPFGDEVGVRAADPEKSVSLLINRFGPVGEVTLRAIAPDWLEAKLEPQITSGNAMLRLKVVKPDAPPRDRAPVVIEARRTADPNGPVRRLTVPVTLTREYDVQTLAMGVFQGPQYQRALHTVFRGRDNQYDGVRLAGGGRTWVALWANALSAPKDGIATTASLTASGPDGKPLADVKTPTIFAKIPVRKLTTAPPSIDALSDAAYLFELPSDWTTPTGSALKRNVNLVAKLHGPGKGNELFDPDPLKQCATPECLANDLFRVSAVPFERMGNPVRFRWYDLVWSYKGLGGPPKNTDVELRKFISSLVPHRQGGVSITPSAVKLDVSEVVADYDFCLGKTGEERSECVSGLRTELANEVDEYDWDNPTAPFALPVGLASGSAIGGVAITEGGCIDTPGTFNVTCLNTGVAVANANRAWTSVAHESWHLLGEEHADTKCNGNENGQKGSAWVDDSGYGFFDGHVFDRSGAWRGVPGFRFYPRPPSGSKLGPFFNTQQFDFMSYCATAFDTTDGATTDADFDALMSPQNWDRMMERLVFKPPSQARATALRPAQVGGNGLRVSGILTPRGARITRVSPTDQLSADPPDRSSLTLRALDAGGGEVATVPMRMKVAHVDGIGNLTAFSAEIPLTRSRAAGPSPDGPAKIEVLGDRGAIAARERSATVPVVSVSAPPAGRTVGAGKTVEVRWKASDPDGGPFRTYVDYSDDDGRTWRTLHQAAADSLASDTQSLKLPSRLFSRSSKARVRVRVDDGFNEGTGTSKRFAAVGAPPVVRIDSPTAGARLSSDATVVLAGAAVDDRERPLEKGLTWYAGKRKIATGPAATVVGLPAGKRVALRLVVRDRFGRSGSAATTIRVDAAAPRVLSLDAPERISRSAGSFQLRLASTLPSTLTVAGAGIQRLAATASFKPRAYTVRLSKPKGDRLRATLRLVSGGRMATVVVEIARE